MAANSTPDVCVCWPGLELSHLCFPLRRVNETVQLSNQAISVVSFCIKDIMTRKEKPESKLDRLADTNLMT